jgi:pre-mRNA-splicing factor CWC26
MASGAGAGLQTAASVRSAIESKQASERQRLAQLDKSVSGRGAETIHRDKYGRIVDPAVEQHRLQELEREKERRRQQQIDNLKGQQQLREYREQQQTLQAMESAPFARHADDADINRRLRQQMHWNDPMRRKDDEFSAVQIPLSAAESAAAQTALKRKRLYRGGAPPNRFSIQPGYRWDGVDRSNGFEANWFRKQAERAANAAEAYKWSTEDM